LLFNLAQRVANSREDTLRSWLVKRAANYFRSAAEIGIPVDDAVEKRVVARAGTKSHDPPDTTPHTANEMARGRASRLNIEVRLTERVGVLEWRSSCDSLWITRDDRARRFCEQQNQARDHRLQ